MASKKPTLGAALQKHPGALHKNLGVPQGTPIPAAKMKAALAGKKGPLARKEAQAAVNMERARGKK